MTTLSKPEPRAENVGKSYSTNEVMTTVRAFGGNGAHVTLPKDWIGKQVKVTIIEE